MKTQKVGRWVASIVVVVALAVAAVLGVRLWQQHSGEYAVVGENLTEFPAIDKTSLSADQSRLIGVLQREFKDPGAGTKYAEGREEPWCADFVSWAMREAGLPLANPNSGSWRIPGVYTLQEYYERTGRFTGLSRYPPRTGDVLLYSDRSPFTQHTNIVLAYDNGVVTTIGGNEFDDVRISRFVLADVPGVVGLGRLHS
ncbi:CHAP domain-containing protein [Nocardia sp. XZ_19_385]|uniref:CHAP domain-containing protein n=1 Tax=Nocardia sp. XZ_19_385 TaxID=2769488 RepID=UPI00188F5C8D|nr:CHAP domain-containing protein [Nocardia sp. XZ_19_385]